MSHTQVLEERGQAGRVVNPLAQSKSVLIVEDDPAVARLIRLYLARAGYEVLVAEDGAEGLSLALERRPSLVVLDLNLPGMDGIEVCKRLRTESDVSIIMVTARVEEEDRLSGLNIGADDYVTKPFSPRELVARVNAVLRRSKPGSRESTSDKGRLAMGDIAMDLDTRTVTVGNETSQIDADRILIAGVLHGRHRQDGLAGPVDQQRPRIRLRRVRPNCGHPRIESQAEVKVLSGRRPVHQDGLRNRIQV